MTERDHDKYDNNMNAFTDSQLEESLDAILFDPAFGGGMEERNVVGDASVTSANSGAPPPALHLGGAMSPQRSFAVGQKDEHDLSFAQMPALNNFGASQMNTTGVTSTNLTRCTNTPGGAMAPPMGYNNTQATKPQYTGTPQLFGKSVPFSAPLPPRDSVAKTLKPPPALSSTTTTSTSSGKRKRGEPDSFLDNTYAVSEDESERQRRRQDRNQREQQRSQQISNQIVELRSLLSDAGMECKADKYSTLASLVDYVRELQQKSSVLDSQHKDLLETIRQTTEVMSSQYMSVQANQDTTAKDDDAAVIGGVAPKDDDEVYIQGIDYAAIFRSSPFALATTSIDGRFLDCSEGFQKLTRFSREELLPGEKKKTQPSVADDSSSLTSDMSLGNMSGSEDPRELTAKNLSLFNVLFQGDMGLVYHAMYDILQQPMNHMDDSTSGESSGDEPDEPIRERSDHWSNDVRLSRDKEAHVKLYLNLVRTMQERPRFFNCTLVPDENPNIKVPAQLAA
mmetsp:Transcript_6408/g.12820  ORF Transcript_6408/g.12820 Transcript_6408/m.12820 type:complete len:509 (-) Transcript_6408:343-1869(-)|eukprot:scaffold83_cov181-Amphora_coffeaeformis.AAC.24